MNVSRLRIVIYYFDKKEKLCEIFSHKIKQIPYNVIITKMTDVYIDMNCEVTLKTRDDCDRYIEKAFRESIEESGAIWNGPCSPPHNEVSYNDYYGVTRSNRVYDIICRRLILCLQNLRMFIKK